MAGQSRVDQESRGRHKADRVMNAQYCCGAIRAFLQWGQKCGFMTFEHFAFGHAHHAMVLTIAPAARGQIFVTLRREREERRSKRQAEDGQQRDDDEPAHHDH